ncbi:platelet-activating factor acetylhydrolase [Elysia marginata]|uniref:1-alkyl-2-acetylglycerophosphocholine esterase n=1 Tax=Elysia marginata TaxID=1093978 RepID=A0AAV4HZ35_9GAST|nr:platelet-activating factor acetylhydrolase [Elysia marginata]
MYFLKKNRTIFGRLANWLGGDVYVPVLWQAPLIKSEESFPVLIVSHGIGGNRTTLSTYCYELASRGFVVAAIEHRDGTASMTLCLREHLASSIIDSDEADNQSNNNDSITVNNNSHTRTNQQHHENNQQCRLQREAEYGKQLRQPQRSSPQSDNQSLDVLLEDICEMKQLNQLQRAFATSFAIEPESASAIENNDSPNFNVATSGTNSIICDGRAGYALSSPQASKEVQDSEKDSVMPGVSASSQAQLPTAAPSQDYRTVRDSSDVACCGAWIKQRRENRRRSLRHNHSCSEEWRPFQHVEVWDDFDYRNGQMYQRADEISDLLDELISMNAGGHINNALGLAFNTNQFKSMTDFQFIVPQVVGRLIDVCHTLQPAQCMSTILDVSLAFLRKHIDLPIEPYDKDILDCKHPHLIHGTNVDLTIPDDGPTPP